MLGTGSACCVGETVHQLGPHDFGFSRLETSGKDLSGAFTGLTLEAAAGQHFDRVHTWMTEVNI